jgi:hypothetical protein
VTGPDITLRSIMPAFEGVIPATIATAYGATVVRDDEQALEAVIGHEPQQGADTEQIVEQLERGLGELAEFAAVVEPGDEHAQPVEGAGTGCAPPQPAGRTLPAQVL